MGGGGEKTPPKKFFLKNIYFGGGGVITPLQNGLGGVITPPKIVGGAYGTPKVGVIFFGGGIVHKILGVPNGPLPPPLDAYVCHIDAAKQEYTQYLWHVK